MQPNVWGSDFFYLINKIPFNVGIKNRGRRQCGRRRVCKLVRAKLGSLGEVAVSLVAARWLVAVQPGIITEACDSYQRSPVQLSGSSLSLE